MYNSVFKNGQSYVRYMGRIRLLENEADVKNIVV